MNSMQANNMDIKKDELFSQDNNISKSINNHPFLYIINRKIITKITLFIVNSKVPFLQ